MQLATPTPAPQSVTNFAAEETPDPLRSRYSEYKVIRRYGE